MKSIEGKLVKIEGLENLIVVGDLHGDFNSFKKIVDEWRKQKGYIIFLGDYADRGSSGLEIIESLMELKKDKNVILLKGNHEDYDKYGRPSFSPCTLIHEVEQKMGEWKSYFSKKLEPFLNELNLAAIVDKILFVHGGISSRIRSIEDLKHPSKQIEEDVIWSDPKSDCGKGEFPNYRGAGVEFGTDIVQKVFSKLGVDLLIRSHQPTIAKYGPYFALNDMVIIISSTDIYGGIPHYLNIPGNKIDAIAKNSREILKYTKFLH
ncbi:MAG: serine/threonine protein phosphatase [Candidatus Parvarchaeota archaeon]|nr:serine/threonine protein phosphatase [Candidatus Jingweiarchaeum tengchongense]MCW1297813.1 serine/threonine protein phosphatase [Candidatus Jingweiarchaeum tengchongense]MCW1299823.1 serine/threonine protein phosphatase [Candidatus Jingweiarchaeum tengchongense]MCW1304206.1 serine/threonine protein phosphatase [Candidatus Jingweiarchaeum tengchongense]MCW1305234.1 serine/threonine protein phosphatase [Candidatus Jingweiarchaeum tengchongense]